MRESYVDAIADASDILVQTILADEEGLCGRIRLSDSLIRDLLREIGRLVFAALVLHVVEQVTADAKYPGMTPYRSRVIRYYSLFGPICQRRWKNRVWSQSVGSCSLLLLPELFPAVVGSYEP